LRQRASSPAHRDRGSTALLRLIKSLKGPWALFENRKELLEDYPKMKIAAVSDNGTTISQHFGRAPMYIVLTIEKGKVVAREKRLRSADNTCACHDGHVAGQSDCHSAQGGHSDAASEAKHTGMADAIADCQYVIARGMGPGAYLSLKNRNLEPIITSEENIEQAVSLFIDGKLPSLRYN
jgi:predicted Fe-Mo cluster-binding NifX family protein